MAGTRRSPRAALVAAALILAAVSLVVAGKGLLPGSALYGSDIYLQFNAWRHYGFSVLRAGAVPLWNPHAFCGSPFVAGMQSAVFYPLNAVFLVLPASQAVDVSIVTHLFLAAVLMYAWLRSLGLSFSASLTGALVFGFSGFPLTHLFGGHLPQLNTWAWMPAAFLATGWLVRTRRASAALLLALVLALQVTAGHPQFLYLTVLGIFAYGGALTLRRALAGPAPGLAVGRTVLLGLGACALGCGLAAVQLIPALEFAAHGSRGTAPASFGFATMASLPPENLLTFLVPGLFGTYDFIPYLDPLARPALESLYWGRWVYWELCPFVGVVPLLLAAVAAGRRERFHTVFWTVLALAAAALALGRYNPLYGTLLKVIPGLGSFRTPGRFLCLSGFALATLAGFGLEALLAADVRSVRKRARAVATAAAILVVVTAGTMVWARSPGWSGFVSSQLARGERWGALPGADHPGFLAGTRAGATRGAAAAIAALAAGGILLILRERCPSSRAGRRALAALVPAVVILELWHFGRGYVRAIPPAAFDWDPGLVKALDAEPAPARLLALTDTASLNRGMRHGISNAAGNDSAIPASFNRLANVIQGTPPGTPLSIVRLSRPSPLRDLLGATHVLVPRGRGAPAGAALAWQGDAAALYRYARPAPHAFVVHDWRVIPGSDEAWAMIAAGGLDPERTVALETPPPPGFRPAPAETPRAATVTRPAPGRIEVEAELAADGFLVLRETAYPGWQARAKGATLPLYRAYAVFQAVPLRAGAHRVIFTYRPVSFRAGAWISLASCALLCIMASRRRQSPPEGSPAA